MNHSTPMYRTCWSIPLTVVFLGIASLTVSAPSTELDTSRLPAPIFEAEPGYVDLYWKAWELAYKHIATDDGAVQSPFMDEGRVDGKISLWESAFTAHFTKYAPDIFPGIESLNEYYAQIHDNATSSQTIEHRNNPPILAWAEWKHFLMTGDVTRVKWLLEEKEYLQKHFAWFHDNQQRQWNQWGKGYGWTHAASGMMNAPRGRYTQGKNDICEGSDHSWTCTKPPSLIYPSGDGMPWIDAIAQQCLSAKCMYLLAGAIGNTSLADEWKETWETYSAIVEEFYWTSGRYFDHNNRTGTSPQHPRTVAVFWPLVSEAASIEHAERTINDLVTNAGFFGDAAPFPSLVPADIDADLDGRGWRGGVYPPMAYMGIQGLKAYGYTQEAARLARNMIEHMYRTYVDFEPHTIWEAYSPTERRPATDTGGVDLVHPDYVGWSGLGPISLLIEHVVGFHTIDASTKRVEWNLHWPEKHGIKRLSFGSVRTDIVYENGTVTASTNEAYTLVINGEEHPVSAGEPVTIAVAAPPAPEPLPPLVRYPVGQGIRVEAEGEVVYPVDTTTSFYDHLCEWPWRFICECSQGWKVWCAYHLDGGTEFEPLPKGNALLMRIAFGGTKESPVHWQITVNGEDFPQSPGHGGEWQYVIVRDVPLTREVNTFNVATTSRSFLSLDFVEVLTFDSTGSVMASGNVKRTDVAGNNLLRAAGGGLFVMLSRGGMTTVDIIDMSGRHVARPVQRHMSAGTHRLSLPEEVRMPGAVYVARLISEQSNRTRTLLLTITD